MATDDECLRVAREYARLAGLTKHRNVRDQLLHLARGWTAIAQHERRSDPRVLRFTPATTSRGRDGQTSSTSSNEATPLSSQATASPSMMQERERSRESASTIRGKR